MNPRSLLRRLLLSTLLVGLSAASRAADWQSLVGNSPFGQTTAATTAATGDLEFRGVVQEEGVYLVNLYNPTTKTSQWVPANGKVPGIEVKSYEAGSDKVQVVQAGRPLTLPLKQAHVALVAAAPKGGNPEEGDEKDQESRRAQIRDMIRSRMQNGSPGDPSAMRNLPPEAQAMIEEFRRRRSENGGPNGNGGGSQSIQTIQSSKSQTQGQGGGHHRDRQQ